MFWLELKDLRKPPSTDDQEHSVPSRSIDCDNIEMKNLLNDNEKTLPTTSAGSKKDLVDDTPYQRNMKLLFCFIGALHLHLHQFANSIHL